MSGVRLSGGLGSSTKHEEMSHMYNALNEQFMFQEVRDRRAALSGIHDDLQGAHTGRRWWRRGDRRTR